MLAFVRRLIELRREHLVFRRTRFLEGRESGSGLPDVWWFRPDGRRMARRDWQADTKALGVFLNGQEIPGRGERGEPLSGHSFLLLLNAHHERVTFVLPPRRFGLRWALELSTAEPDAEPVEWRQRDAVEVEGRALVLIRRAL
jgi:glycogen operon protein